jgi:hypothetical protein
VALAWGSIVDDVQAEKELKTADEVLPRAARECYKWLLCRTAVQPYQGAGIGAENHRGRLLKRRGAPTG